MAAISFNPVGVPRDVPLTVLPAGNYAGMVVNTDVRETKQKTGKYIWLEIAILTQGFQGRKVWGRINYENNSPEAQRIGQGQLGALLDAVGLGNQPFTDTNVLHNKQIGIRVKIDNTGPNGPQNEVNGYMPVADVGGASAMPTMAGAPGRPAAAPTAPPPWQQQAQQQPVWPQNQQPQQPPAQQGFAVQSAGYPGPGYEPGPATQAQAQPPAQALAPAPVQQFVTPAVQQQVQQPVQQPVQQQPTPEQMQAAWLAQQQTLQAQAQQTQQQAPAANVPPWAVRQA